MDRLQRAMVPHTLSWNASGFPAHIIQPARISCAKLGSHSRYYTRLRRDYKKTGGAATTKGQQFEYCLVALLYLRIISWAESFFLGSNLKGLGQFDDVFLKLNWKDNRGHQRTDVYCIQLKHKENRRVVPTSQLLQDKGDFGLLRYYKSYCKIEDAITGNGEYDNYDIIRGNNFEDYHFILFTNSTVIHKSKDVRKEDLSKLENILNTAGEKPNIFSFGPEDNDIWRLRDKCGDSNRYHAFLRRLRIFSGQRGVDQLKELVDQDVARCAKVKDSVTLSSKFLKSIENWWNDDSTFLTERSPQWYEYLIKDLNAQLTDKLQNLEYEFKLGKNTHLDGNVETDTYLNIVVPGIHADVRCLKIWLELENKCKGCYLLMDVSDFVRRKEQVLFMLKKGLCDYLVINTHDTLDIKHLISDLHPVLCKVVIVSGRNTQTGNMPCFNCKEDAWTFGNLTEESQERILTSIVDFQGEDVSLAELCGRDIVDEALGSKALGTLLKGGKVIMGSSLAGVDELYISRTLRHQSVLRGEVLLAKHKDDIFTVSGFPQERLVASNSSIVMLSTAESDSSQRSFSGSDHPDKTAYLEVCNKFKHSKNVHWVTYEGERVIWRESCGSKETPCRYIDSMSSSCVCGTTCCHGEGLPADWRERLVLVTGEPGMGKSTLLNHLATEVKKQNPASWVVHVALNNFSSSLKNMPVKNMTLEQVVAILEEAAHIFWSTCPELSRKLLLDGLVRRGNVTVLLDAVDEVSPHYMEQVVRIVQLLLETKVSKIWVTSRTVLQEHLQRELASLPLILQPFTEKEQIVFLTHYLAQREGNRNLDVESFQELAVQLLKFMNTGGTSLGRHICDVPLHARMSVDTVNQLISDSPDPINYTETLRKLNLHRIYENFFNRKREIYYEKCGVNTAQPAMSSTTKREDTHFMENHMKCALHVVFSPQEYRSFNIPDLHDSVQIFLKEIVNERSGIIEGVTEGKAKFVHYTFCEYLAAKWFKQWYEENKCNGGNNRGNVVAGFSRFKEKTYRMFARFGYCNQMRKSFKSLLDLTKFDQLRLFLDQMLSDKCELHQAVLTGSAQYVSTVIRAGAGVGEIDQGGRLALHLAAARGNSEIVNLLLKAGSDVGVCDNVLGWRPLRYADRAQSWDVAVQLLQHGAKEADMRILKRKVKDKRIWRTIISAAGAGNSDTTSLFSWMGSDISGCNIQCALMFAIKAGHSQVIQILLEQNISVNETDSEEDTPLHVAAQCGHVEAMRMLLEHEADVHATNRSSKTPLHVSAEHGPVEAMRVLLEHDGNVQAKDSNGDTPLLVAVRRGQLEKMRVLLQHGSDVSTTTSFGYTPLHLALRSGHVGATRILLEHGADVHAAGGDGYTPLHVTARCGHAEAIRVLIEHGADVQAKDRDRYTPLHFAALNGHVECMLGLLQHGADLHATSRDGNTALHVAAWHGQVEAMQVLLTHGADVCSTGFGGNTPLIVATQHGQLEAMRMLLEHGADIHASGLNGQTPLHVAVLHGAVEAMHVLLKQGADVSAIDSDGNSPLHAATWDSHVTAMRVLLEYGANTRTSGSNGQTPLHVAVLHGAVEAMQVLLKHGADVGGADTDGNTPLHAAARGAQVESLRVLLEHGADARARRRLKYTSYHATAWDVQVESVRVLLQHGADVGSVNSDGNTPLHVASCHGQVETVRVLLEHEADVRAENSDTNSPLYLAAWHGQLEAVRVLLEHGANVRAVGRNGCTPLHVTALHNFVDIMRLLLKRGADVRDTNTDGNTPLHITASHDQVEAMRVLLVHGADVCCVNNDGSTPLHVGAWYGHVEAMYMLLEQGADVRTANKDGNIPLHVAAWHVQVEAIRMLLDHGSDVRASNNEGNTPLHAVAWHGHLESVRVLLEHGADMRAMNSEGYTPLHAAVVNGHVDTMRVLLQHRA